MSAAKIYAERLDRLAKPLSREQRRAVCGLIEEAFDRFERLQAARAALASAKEAVAEAEGYFFLATNAMSVASAADDD